MNYVMYCRKSQESEDRQILSLESQEQELMERFGDDSSITISHQFSESKSAKAPGREQFNEMIELIQAGKAEGIMAWHPDRLARNSVDGGLIIYLLDIGVLKDLKFVTYHFENTPEGKMMLAHLFTQSKYFVDGLSKSVKRGNKTKLKKCWRPNIAPIGYLNCKETKTIIPDPKRFSIIQDIFALMKTGCYTPKMLYEKAKDEFALKTPIRKRTGGKSLSLSGMHRLLSNPFYTGLILWKGELYEGKHKPAVSIEDFEAVQKILKRRSLKPSRHKKPKLQFAYTGLIRCGECECAITAEKKVNRFNSHYVYYRYTHRKTNYVCKQKSLEVRKLENQFKQFLESIVIDEEMHDLILEQAVKEKDKVGQSYQSKISSLDRALTKSKNQSETILQMRMDELISNDEFKDQRSKLQFEQKKLVEQIEKLGNVNVWFAPFKDYLEARKQAIKWFENGSLEVKRLIMKSVGSHAMIMDKKLSIQAAKPFFQIPKNATNGDLLGVVQSFRKHYGHCDVRVTLSILMGDKEIGQRQKFFRSMQLSF